MKHPKLYIKNDKGRYEPYKLPEPNVSDTVYRKINGKFEPVGFFQRHDYLSEGIWVVYCDHALCNGKYLKEKFRLEKVSDLQYPTIAQLGGIQSAIDQAWRELSDFQRDRMNTIGYSVFDTYEFVARRTVEIIMERNKPAGSNV